MGCSYKVLGRSLDLALVAPILEDWLACASLSSRMPPFSAVFGLVNRFVASLTTPSFLPEVYDRRGHEPGFADFFLVPRQTSTPTNGPTGAELCSEDSPCPDGR